MLISGLVSVAVVNLLMPSDRARRRPVAGTICISPQAFATDLACGSKVDSCAMRAAMRYGSSPCSADCLRIDSQYVSGKMTCRISVGSCSPPAVRCCGYARRINVIARRSSPIWWYVQAIVASIRVELPHARCA